MITQAIEKFESVTGYPLGLLISEFAIFVETGYGPLVAYYSGTRETLEPEVFTALDNLAAETGKVLALYRQHHGALPTLRDWELLEYVEEMRTKLATIRNLPKYLRSSRTTRGFGAPGVGVTYTLRRYETLENVSERVLSDATPQDDWQRIALANDLSEDEYSPAGGTPLDLILPGTGGLKLESVIGAAVGKEMYGRDLCRKFQFVDNDLRVLSPEETALQAIEILLNLKRGDVPETPGRGLNPALVVGQSANLLGFPMLTRQLEEVFSTDDTLVSFKIVKLEREADGLRLDVEVNTRYSLVHRTAIKL